MPEKLTKANSVDLCSESFGDRQDPTVLLIMGAMASMVWWPEEFCCQIAKVGRHVIRYDHRDTGRSVSFEVGRIAYSLEDLADDAVGLLDAYQVRAAHLVGMSLGGLLAQLVALKYAERVLTVTAIASERLGPEDPKMPPMDPKIPAYHGRSTSLDWSNREAVMEYSVQGWRLLAGTRHPFDEAGIRTMAGQDFDRANNLHTIMNHALLSGGECWHNRLAEVRAPALVIHGTEDPVLPYAHGVALAEALPHSKMITLWGAGHELHRADWKIIIDAIIRHTGG